MKVSTAIAIAAVAVAAVASLATVEAQPALERRQNRCSFIGCADHHDTHVAFNYYVASCRWIDATSNGIGQRIENEMRLAKRRRVHISSQHARGKKAPQPNHQATKQTGMQPGM
ncbi:hypothetical protein SYNPS1DRAFT_30418 [Syncephalis pseudoplumigaleata]|uniref:Uncharacterized protein n=1 Tax=Syncephalis pseudoplumigaleata TaxID=1712513 RepID=A0A4P9YWG5_9FUNG|nr:hypothetical protein SYNPS1DRAFT_30418 [Syncephalis pseudoplumigaleata]|eukprot:RKP23822.1 hypothetical protein SYNPS1DRAFT_30418 [Syncephalis pseudoplumigaleata]